MRRNIFVAGLASLTLVLGACGADNEERAQTVDPAETGTPAGEPESTSETESASADLDIDAALLTLHDMPTGWTQESSDTPTDSDDDASLCGAELLDGAEAVSEAGADFSAGDLGPLLSHTVAVFDDDGAERGLEAFTQALENCEEWTEDTEDGPVTFRPAPLSFPSFGDETLAIRFDVGSEMVDMTMDMITWRQDNTLNLIVVMEVFGTPDGEQTEEFVTVADERISSLL